jgi:hypothetical protein
MQRVELVVVGLLLRQQPPDQRQRAREVRHQSGTPGELASDVAIDAAEEGLQPFDLTPGAPHLARMRVAVRQPQCAPSDPLIALPQLDAMPGRKPHQDLAAAVIEPRIQGMRNGLRLHRRINCHALETARFHRP